MFWSALKAKVNTGLKYFQNIVKILDTSALWKTRAAKVEKNYFP